MKKSISILTILLLMCLITAPSFAQPGTENLNMVNVQMLKTKWPEKGTMIERDSLIAIYNEKVIRKNEHILSHREFSHWFTASNKDYMVIQEFKSFDSMQKANELNVELEKKAWPDEKQRKAFFDAMDSYFEDWHGDALYRYNPKLSK